MTRIPSRAETDAAGNSRRRTLVVAGLVSIAVLVGCGGSETSEPDRNERSGAKSEPVPEQVFYDYRLKESEDAVPQWILQSQEMRKYTGRQDVELITVKMDFYDEGEYFSTLTSDSGTADTHSKDVYVWGHVVVVTADGRRLLTEELYYDSRTGLVHNDVFNTLEEGEDVVTGIGLEATPDLKRIVIKQQVAAEIGDESVQEQEEK